MEQYWKDEPWQRVNKGFSVLPFCLDEEIKVCVSKVCCGSRRWSQSERKLIQEVGRVRFLLHCCWRSAKPEQTSDFQRPWNRAVVTVLLSTQIRRVDQSHLAARAKRGGGGRPGKHGGQQVLWCGSKQQKIERFIGPQAQPRRCARARPSRQRCAFIAGSLIVWAASRPIKLISLQKHAAKPSRGRQHQAEQRTLACN